MKTLSVSALENELNLTEELYIPNVPPGIKRLRTVTPPAEGSKAYNYGYFDLNNGGKLMYDGYHGDEKNGVVPDGSYWHSSKTHKAAMDKLMYSKDSNILYAVLGYGSLEEMKKLEASILAEYKPVYNDSKGSASNPIDTSLVDKAFENIAKGTWRNETRSSLELYNLGRYQARIQQIIEDKVRELLEVFQGGGYIEDSVQVVLIETSPNVYKLIDGNHTVNAIYKWDPNKENIPVSVIPYHISKDLGAYQRKLLALRLNPQIKVKKDANSEADNINIIYEICKEKGITDPTTNVQLKGQLALSNHSNAQISRILKGVKVRLDREGQIKKRGHIKDYTTVKENIDAYKKKEEELTGEESTCYKSSSALVSEGNICRHIREKYFDAKGKLKKNAPKHLNVLLYHPTNWEKIDEWETKNKKEVEENLKIICRGAGITFSIHFMPHELNQKA
jgi:hypothetical protein